MEQEIDITKLEKIGLIDYEQIAKDSFIDVNVNLPHPPTALSIGEYRYGENVYPIRFGTLGNFSCIVGATKSMKTYLKSLIIACYIGGNSNEYAPEIKTHREEDKYIIDIDTEQGDWDAQRVFKRVPQICGGQYVNYKPFYLRKLDFKERLQFIEYLLFESYMRGKVGFVSIDGFADLVSDVNDLEQSNKLTQKLLKWTDEGNFHLTGILHKNFGTAKPTGHLGSAILKKAETVCMLDRIMANEKDPTNYINVSFPYTRGYKIDDFQFTINEYGLPKIERYSEIPF